MQLTTTLALRRMKFAWPVIVGGAVALSLSLAPTVEGQASPRGSVRMTGIKLSVPELDASRPCAIATVNVEVDKRGVNEDPALDIATTKRKSTPPDLNVDINPPWMEVTVPGSAAFHFRVCRQEGSKAGSLEIGAGILRVIPEARYEYLQTESNLAARATLSILP